MSATHASITANPPAAVIPPLRTVRQARGMSLETVANAAGIDAAHLSRVERGMASLSVDALARLARVLGLRELAQLLAPYARGNDAPRTAA